jgi:hypothetical protein
MTIIYLDVDGVLLRRSPVSRKGFQLSPYAEEFLAHLVASYNVFWLTTRCRADMPNDLALAFRHAMQVASLPPKLAKLIDAVEPAVWNSCKTEGVDLTANFFWIDDKLTPKALQVLATNGCQDRWIKVQVDQDPDDLVRVSQILEERISAVKRTVQNQKHEPVAQAIQPWFEVPKLPS